MTLPIDPERQVTSGPTSTAQPPYRACPFGRYTNQITTARVPTRLAQTKHPDKAGTR